jgi:hypothetical protein
MKIPPRTDEEKLEFYEKLLADGIPIDKVEQDFIKKIKELKKKLGKDD